MPQRIPTHRSGPPGHDPRRAYERSRTRRDDKNFYSSKRWRAFRAWWLSLHPLCVDCEKQGRHTTAIDVHHVLERKDRPDLAFDESNVEGLCKACHGAKRRGQQG